MNSGQITKSPSIFAPLFVIGTSLILAADTIGSYTTSTQLFALHSGVIGVINLAIYAWLRWHQHQSLMSQAASKLLTACAAIGIVLTTSATLVDIHSGANTFFALTRLNHPGLMTLTIFWFGLVVLEKTNLWWAKHLFQIISLLPVISWVLLTLIFYFPYDLFDQLIKEDRPIEYVQVIVLLLGASWLIKKALRLSAKLPIVVFLIVSLAFILVAGDEIAWGQRLLGIAPTPTIEQLNRQSEYTVHNLTAIEWMVAYGYAVLAVGGLVLSLSKRSYLTSYFVLPTGYFLAQLVVDTGIWHPWSEVAELYLYAGIVGWLIVISNNFYPTQRSNLNDDQN